MAKARNPRRLYKQFGSDNWFARFTLNGVTVRESTGTSIERDAKRWVELKRAEILEGTYTPRANSVTVRELVKAKLDADRANGIGSVQRRWKLHLEPFFQSMKASQVTTPLLRRYTKHRQEEGFENATINRELALLRRAFYQAQQDNVIKVVPYFPMLKENNVRKGFLRDDVHERLLGACRAEGEWLAGMEEVAYYYGWRRGELLFGLTVEKVDFAEGTIWLYRSKNGEGRVVYMNDAVRAALLPLCKGKFGTQPLFTRPNGTPVHDYRDAWARATKAAGVPGLYLHDLRRTARRNFRRQDIGDTVAMKIMGHKTDSMSKRYDIVDEEDLREAARRQSKTVIVDVIARPKTSSGGGPGQP